MGMRPEALKGSGRGQTRFGHVDYRLARNSVVSEFRKGRLSRLDVCDAHPELLRAAANVGDESQEDCPICEEAKLKLVSYAFGARLGPAGVCVNSSQQVTKLAATAGEITCYVVEVCPSCAWNHLAGRFLVTSSRSNRRRSGP